MFQYPAFLLPAFFVGAALAIAQQQDNVILDLSKSSQVITVKLGDIPASTVRVSVTTGENFPIANSKWQGAASVVGSGAAVATYHKVWKGSLDEISVKELAVVVYQRPVEISTSYGGHRYELRDMNIASDFKLTPRGKAVQLEVLTWYQLPNGVRKKLTITLLNREQGVLQRALMKAQRARDSISQLQSALSAAEQQGRTSDGGGNVAGGRANFAAGGIRRQIAKAEADAAAIPDIEQSLNVLPEMVRVGEQLHQRANFGVRFWAEQNGKTIELHPEPVAELKPAANTSTLLAIH